MTDRQTDRRNTVPLSEVRSAKNIDTRRIHHFLIQTIPASYSYHPVREERTSYPPYILSLTLMCGLSVPVTESGRNFKFVITLSLKIPLHLKCVATSPCEMSESHGIGWRVKNGEDSHWHSLRQAGSQA